MNSFVSTLQKTSMQLHLYQGESFMAFITSHSSLLLGSLNDISPSVLAKARLVGQYNMTVLFAAERERKKRQQFTNIESVTSPCALYFVLNTKLKSTNQEWLEQIVFPGGFYTISYFTCTGTCFRIKLKLTLQTYHSDKNYSLIIQSLSIKACLNLPVHVWELYSVHTKRKEAGLDKDHKSYHLGEWVWSSLFSFLKTILALNKVRRRHKHERSSVFVLSRCRTGSHRCSGVAGLPLFQAGH